MIDQTYAPQPRTIEHACGHHTAYAISEALAPAMVALARRALEKRACPECEDDRAVKTLKEAPWSAS